MTYKCIHTLSALLGTPVHVLIHVIIEAGKHVAAEQFNAILQMQVRSFS